MMQIAANDYRANPTHPAIFKKNSKKVREAQVDLDHKNAFIRKEISLGDYLHAQAANIAYYYISVLLAMKGVSQNTLKKRPRILNVIFVKVNKEIHFDYFILISYVMNY